MAVLLLLLDDVEVEEDLDEDEALDVDDFAVGGVDAVDVFLTCFLRIMASISILERTPSPLVSFK